ncbi:hypothetical protein GCM10009122_47620 [Fulvivirga kasyanovii]|uniref:DUF6252 family protein n=1 Tax=Fulvivirga kasyanovii TaxID=396812 RepID=UPI0031D46532
MNKYFTHILAPVSLALLAIGFSACQEDDELPAITSEGKNTFGCLVNGDLWLPKGSFNVPSTAADYTSGYFLSFSARSENTTFRFTVEEPILINHRYDLTDTTRVRANYTNKTDNNLCFYKDYHVLNGSLEITKFSLAYQNKVLSGTFEFTTYNPDCGDTIKVTEGRFDIGDITY